MGISSKDAILQCHGYAPLLGWDDQSWGWNLVDNYLLHNGDAGNFPLLTNAPKYQVGEKIKVILDCESHCLAFEKNNEFLGVAFRNLPCKKLYPTITAVYGNTEVSMVYCGYPFDGWANFLVIHCNCTLRCCIPNHHDLINFYYLLTKIQFECLVKWTKAFYIQAIERLTIDSSTRISFKVLRCEILLQSKCHKHDLLHLHRLLAISIDWFVKSGKTKLHRREVYFGCKR